MRHIRWVYSLPFLVLSGMLAALCALVLLAGRLIDARASSMVFLSNRSGNEDIFAADIARGLRVNLTRHHDTWDGMPDRSPDGTRIAFASLRDGDAEIYIMNVDGSGTQQITHNQARDLDPVWSPDGTRLAFVSDRDGNWEIYTMDINGGDQRRLTYHSADDQAPGWSPDGTQIAYVTYHRGNAAIFLMNADGSHPHPIAANSRARFLHPAWSPDGEQIALASDKDSGDFEIYLMNVRSGDLRRLTFVPALDTNPSWTPDGRRLLFESWRDGNPEIYIMDADGSNTRRLTDDRARDTDPS